MEDFVDGQIGVMSWLMRVERMCAYEYMGVGIVTCRVVRTKTRILCGWHMAKLTHGSG